MSKAYKQSEWNFCSIKLATFMFDFYGTSESNATDNANDLLKIYSWADLFVSLIGILWLAERKGIDWEHDYISIFLCVK